MSVLMEFVQRFRRDNSGSVLPLLALAAVPIMGAMAAAVDYTRVATERTKLQAAVDTALLAGANDGTSNWQTVAANITALCGAARPSATWAPARLPSAPGVITVTVRGITEYHVCGDLTVTGTGYLTGTAPGGDSTIVIENGSLNVDSDANIS